MDREYNLDRVGKKMPFTMPEDFFGKVQANVLAQVALEEQKKKKHPRKAMMRRIWQAAASVAASVSMLLLIGNAVGDNDSSQEVKPVASMAPVDKAYDQLSAEEQQEVYATYANDVLLGME